MKRNSVLKSIVLSAAVSAILTGCGSSGASTDAGISAGDKDIDKNPIDTLKAISIKGKAVDGYLQFASVCLDLNKDGYCQSTEPMSATNADGSFSLDISTQIQELDTYKEAMLLVYGGKDADTGVDFNGKLLAPQGLASINVTPITTLVAKAVQKELKANPNLTKEEIIAKVAEKKEEVAKVFGIEVADIDLDPIAVQETNPELIKHSLKIQKSIEAIAGGTGDDEKIEEIYEKLAEKLIQAQDKGLDSLLNEAYKNDAKLEEAKAVSANIEKAYRAFDGDLKKVAFITKQDMKKVRAGKNIEKEDNDPRFKIPEADWNKEFVKADLKDIGIANPTDEEIEAIIDSIGVDKVLPGAVFKKAKEWEKESNEEFKKIYKEAKKVDEANKKKDEVKKAQKDGKIYKFTAGTKLYEFGFDKEPEYTEIIVGSDDVTFKEFSFVSDSWSERVKDYNDIDYILKDGSWVERIETDNHKSVINADGTLTLADDNLQVTLLNQKDVSNQKIYIPQVGFSVAMPKGAKVSYLGFKTLKDEYRLNHKIDTDTTFSSISEYIQNQCESISGFTDKDGKECDANTLSGALNHEGTWKVKEIEGTKYLSISNWWQEEVFDKAMKPVDSPNHEYILALKDGQLYEGVAIKANMQKEPDLEYNEVAIDAIKDAIINYSNSSLDFDMPSKARTNSGIVKPIFGKNTAKSESDKATAEVEVSKGTTKSETGKDTAKSESNKVATEVEVSKDTTKSETGSNMTNTTSKQQESILRKR